MAPGSGRMSSPVPVRQAAPSAFPPSGPPSVPMQTRASPPAGPMGWPRRPRRAGRLSARSLRHPAGAGRRRKGQRHREKGRWPARRCRQAPRRSGAFPAFSQTVSCCSCSFISQNRVVLQRSVPIIPRRTRLEKSFFVKPPGAPDFSFLQLRGSTAVPSPVRFPAALCFVGLFSSPAVLFGYENSFPIVYSRPQGLVKGQRPLLPRNGIAQCRCRWQIKALRDFCSGRRIGGSA